VHVEKSARVHFIPDLKVWAFVTLRTPIAVKIKSSKQLPKGLFLDLICISQNDFALKWGFVGQKPCIPIVYVTSRFSKESV
jgi:hypothetical protein